MRAFWEGALAGYGIAVPVGAIAVLIVDVGLRRGFSLAFMAGAGAATADFIYAGLAALAGEVLAVRLEPYASSLSLISAFVLLGMGGIGFFRAWNKTLKDVERTAPIRGHFRVYTQFLALTLINPLTVVYFSALILGGGIGQESAAFERMIFVIGAGLASLSWQTILALVGAFARRRLSPRFRLITSLLGNIVVIAMGLRILLY